MPISIIDTIKQKNNGVFPVVEDSDVMGGLHTVGTLSGMTTIPDTLRKYGMLVYISGITGNGYYSYNGVGISGFSYIGEFAGKDFVTSQLATISGFLTATDFSSVSFDIIPYGEQPLKLGEALNRWSEVWAGTIYSLNGDINTLTATSASIQNFSDNLLPNIGEELNPVPGVDYNISIGDDGTPDNAIDSFTDLQNDVGLIRPFFHIWGKDIFATNKLTAVNTDIRNLTVRHVVSNLIPHTLDLTIGSPLIADEEGYWSSVYARKFSFLDGSVTDLIPYKFYESESLTKASLGTSEFPWLHLYADFLHGDGSGITNLPTPSLGGNHTISGLWDFTVTPTITISGNTYNIATLGDITTTVLNLVTLNTTQTISGIKTFNSDVAISGGNLSHLYNNNVNFQVTAGGITIGVPVNFYGQSLENYAGKLQYITSGITVTSSHNGKILIYNATTSAQMVFDSTTLFDGFNCMFVQVNSGMTYSGASVPIISYNNLYSSAGANSAVSALTISGLNGMAVLLGGNLI